MLALGETDRASAVFSALPENLRADAALKQVATALELVSQSDAVGDVATIRDLRASKLRPDGKMIRYL